jgi:hypothetical protein
MCSKHSTKASQCGYPVGSVRVNTANLYRCRQRSKEQSSDAGETTQKQWPAKSPHAGTMEGNLARHALTEDPNDDIPFAFAIAVPALALILAAVHHTGALIA